MEKDVFTELYNVNVNEHVEKKNTGRASLSYLSWAWAWAEVKKHYPDANYEIVKFENGLPYSYDPKTGYMCYTRVTIKNVTHEMWLPVMDSHNDAMLAEARTVKTRNGEYTVQACTMFDVNKTIMRCLTKNLAMFGLGLYIYAGEDLPVTETEQLNEQLSDSVLEIINSGKLTENMLKQANKYYETKDIEGMKRLCDWYKSQKNTLEEK